MSGLSKGVIFSTDIWFEALILLEFTLVGLSDYTSLSFILSYPLLVAFVFMGTIVPGLVDIGLSSVFFLSSSTEFSTSSLF